jgi:nitrous oxidase accessory protein
MRRALSLALIAACAHEAPSVAKVPGPADRTAPSGATILRTSEELSDFISDPLANREAWLAPGTYAGPVVIRRPLALHGTSGVIVDGGHAGTVVSIESNDVTLDNVVVRASGRRHSAEDSGIKARGDRIHIGDVRVEDVLFGISFGMCHFCTIEHAHVRGPGDVEELRGDGIKLWESDDSIVRDVLVEDARDVVVWYTRRALLEDLVVRRGRYGTHFMYAHDSIARRSRFERDVVGVFVMYSSRVRLEDDVMAGARGAAGVGVGFKDSDSIDLVRDSIVANTTGAYIDDTPRTEDRPLTIQDSVIALNEVGIAMHTGGSGVHVRGVDFKNNAELIRIDGAGDALAASFEGNHYSDYQGYDLDGNGIGDVAYEVKLLSHELTNTNPTLRLFQGTVALGMIDAVARAAPVLASKRVLVDPSPRMEIP